MQLDLSTLYYLTIGTLLVAVAMTLWERQAHPHRARTLDCWAIGYGAFALGCVLAMTRGLFPGVIGPAAANIVFVVGYLTVLRGTACLDGPVRMRWSVALVAVMALVWATLGPHFPQAVWTFAASVPIAAICGSTARTLLRSRAVRDLRSRPVAVAIFAGHGLYYLFRAALAPVLVAAYGDALMPVLAQITMYEAVLFSVAMPTALTALIREEAQSRLLVAARTDYLTGLDNRHGFFERAQRVLAGHGPDRPVALLAFDLDHFKAINDGHGHAAGDAVLKLFAQVAREVAGPGAILARLGGEEFAALLPGSGDFAARQVGERVASRFAQAAIRGDGPGIPATVSIGIAQARSGGCDLPGLLAAADRALYRAKALGRNRIEHAEAVGIAEAA